MAQLDPRHSAQIEFVWGITSPILTSELTDFWLRNKALPRKAAAQRRASQAVAIARRNGRIVGVSTAVRIWVDRLSCHMWFYRTFTGQDVRSAHLATDLVVKSRDFLEAQFVKGAHPEVRGLFVTVESPILQKNRAVGTWENSRLTFIGFDEKGQHLRVYFFEGAAIPAKPLPAPDDVRRMA